RRAARLPDPRGPGRLDRGPRLARRPRVDDRRRPRRPVAHAPRVLARRRPRPARRPRGARPVTTETLAALPGRAALAVRVRAGWPAFAPAGVLGLAVFLDFFRLDRNGYANTYYAGAVRSMLKSWHNFLFTSFDPGGLVSVDKPPLSLWVEAVSAKIFG